MFAYRDHLRPEPDGVVEAKLKSYGGKLPIGAILNENKSYDDKVAQYRSNEIANKTSYDKGHMTLINQQIAKCIDSALEAASKFKTDLDYIEKEWNSRDIINDDNHLPQNVIPNNLPDDQIQL